MGANVIKVHFFAQRYLGGIGHRNVLLAPEILALYDVTLTYEQAFNKFIRRPDVPHCLGTFAINSGPVLRISSTPGFLFEHGTPLTDSEILRTIRQAFSDNRDPTRTCGDPRIVIDGVSYGTVRMPGRRG